MGVGPKRVRPRDIESYVPNTKLSRKRTVELKIRLYQDQRELLEEYAQDTGLSLSLILKKVTNYFLNCTKTQREKIIRRY